MLDLPRRCWTFPGDTADTAIIRTIRDDLDGWGLRRLVGVADRGFAADRAYLMRGGHYIHAEKLATPKPTTPPPWPAASAPSATTCGSGKCRWPLAGDSDDGARA